MVTSLELHQIIPKELTSIIDKNWLKIFVQNKQEFNRILIIYI